jgi:hypothetical protein
MVPSSVEEGIQGWWAALMELCYNLMNFAK